MGIPPSPGPGAHPVAFADVLILAILVAPVFLPSLGGLLTSAILPRLVRKVILFILGSLFGLVILVSLVAPTHLTIIVGVVWVGL